ncbi:AMP-binding protein, partial [Streptomyces massasporeus]
MANHTRRLVSPRSFDLLVAIHAVVRAGGAYLPLDLTLPADRLAHMTATARPVAILTDLLSESALPEGVGAVRIALDSPAVMGESAGLS